MPVGLQVYVYVYLYTYWLYTQHIHYNISGNFAYFFPQVAAGIEDSPVKSLFK